MLPTKGSSRRKLTAIQKESSMASRPGLFSEWPWHHLGGYKHLLLAPYVTHSIYSYLTKEESERDLFSLLLFPLILSRVVHSLLWTSLSRYHTAKGSNRIVDKSLEFEQVDRESNWDDQVLLYGLIYYNTNLILPGFSRIPFWRTDGFILTVLMHIGPVEYLYYWFHRALHHHFLYARYHSHHHSSIVTEPVTSVIHPFAEHVGYVLLFAMPVLAMIFTGTASIVSVFGYITYVDFMNYMGHCNFELVPKWLFTIFPPLKYLMYTPSFHSLHHTKVRTNYSLFMPLYDYVYNTMDATTDSLHEVSLKKREESADVVHLTHLTTPESIYHLNLGFASLAANPYTSKWYLWLMWPVTFWSMILSLIYNRIVIAERNVFDKLKLQTWVIPKYNFQYSMKWQREAINGFIEEAIVEADKRGVKVISLGFLNQDEELNKSGELYIQRNPNLNIKVVDGSSLAVAIVLNNIAKGATEVLMTGKLSKVAHFVALALCHRGMQVVTLRKDEHDKLSEMLPEKLRNKLVLSTTFRPNIWLVGDGLSHKEQKKATKGTVFIPFSQFPPRKMRKDCFYHHTPSMIVPKSLENVHCCENWLPRRVMSAWRVAGLIYALEGWNVNECGMTVFDVEKIWEASLRHGFRPMTTPTA